MWCELWVSGAMRLSALGERVRADSFLSVISETRVFKTRVLRKF